ncbi:hypothetical protein KIL84_013108, partial [Mauremys mutica]
PACHRCPATGCGVPPCSPLHQLCWCPSLGPQSVRPGGGGPPACRYVISPDRRLRYHLQRPGPCPHPDQEARRPLPPGARLAPRGDLRAAIGKGGGAHGHRGGLQNVQQGGLLPCLRGRRPGGGGGRVHPPGAAGGPGCPSGPDLRPSLPAQCCPVAHRLCPGEAHFRGEPSPLGLQGPRPPSHSLIPPAGVISTATSGAWQRSARGLFPGPLS